MGETPVAQLLAAILEEQGVQKRALAKKLAGKGAADRDIERERRALYKVLAGRQPKVPYAHRLAKALDLPPDTFVREITPRRATLQALREERDELLRRIAELEAGEYGNGRA